MDLDQFLAQEREVCVTILCRFSCICRLSWVCILREISTKLQEMPTSFLIVFSHCLLLLTILPLDCGLTPIGLFCCPLSTALSASFFVNCPCLISDLPFHLHFRSRRRSRVQALCLGFAPKQTKRSSTWLTTPHSVTVSPHPQKIGCT